MLWKINFLFITFFTFHWSVWWHKLLLIPNCSRKFSGAVLDHCPCSWDISGSFNLNKVEREKNPKTHKVLGFGEAANIKWRHSRRASGEGNSGLVQISPMCCSGCNFLIFFRIFILWHEKIPVSDFGADGEGFLVAGPACAQWGKPLDQRLNK